MAKDTPKKGDADPASRFARQWNHKPAGPIATSPIFQWPIRPVLAGRWFVSRWFVFGENLINPIALGNFHHQMHHRYFECHYGNLEVPWDKLFDSFHDGTEQSHEQFLQRRRKLAKRG